MLDRLRKTTLYFKNLRRRKEGKPGAADARDPDAYNRLFGTAEPSKLQRRRNGGKSEARSLRSI